MRRGLKILSNNRFNELKYDYTDWDGIDEGPRQDQPTQFFSESPKSVVSKVKSPDIPMDYSINPYQGCEHGCSYCYARPSHEYWGYNAGLDFESKIMVKHNVVERLVEFFNKRGGYVPKPIMLSGNTDCYQPIERKLGLTRHLLQTFLQYQHPVGIITKNALILRDIDILKQLAMKQLVHVTISINTLDERMRSQLEPRTSTIKKRFEAVSELIKVGVPTAVMVAPVIPSLNDIYMLSILKKAASLGAICGGYTMLRLNGPLGDLFSHWLDEHYPERKEKILNKVKSIHGGSLGDSMYHRRMKGEGNYAQNIRDLYYIHKKRYFGGQSFPDYNLTSFRPKAQLGLFDELEKS